MLDKIRILQLGSDNWSLKYSLADNVDLSFVEKFDLEPKKPYELVFLDRELEEGELAYLQRATKAYTLFVTENVSIQGDTELLYTYKKGQKISHADIQEFLLKESRNYFPSSYGEKFMSTNFSIAQGFNGSVKWDGNCGVELNGEYGDELNQIGFWRNNFPIFTGQAIEMWLEYEKDSGVEIAMSVTQLLRGSLCEVEHKWSFSEE